MRLIDADKVEIDYTGGFVDRYFVNYDSFMNAPTIDAVKVVRCKECKHWRDEDGCPMNYYTYPKTDDPYYYELKFWNKENDFCSYGEREGE